MIGSSGVLGLVAGRVGFLGVSASLQLGHVLNRSPYAMLVNFTDESGAEVRTSAESSKHGPF